MSASGVIRSGLKSGLFLGTRVLGINRAVRWRSGRLPLIVCYHGVIRNAKRDLQPLYQNTVSITDFERQIDYLARNFQTLSLADFAKRLSHDETLPRKAALITFDDGYRNNVELAAPILRRKGVPAVFHLATSYIGSRRTLWPDEVLLRILDWKTPRITVPGGEETGVPVAFIDRIQLASRIKQRCKTLTPQCREQYLSALRDVTPEVPSHYDEEAHTFMTWDEARTLTSTGFELGSHTVTHPILSRCEAATVEQELRQSKQVIEQETGQRCISLAYPNGGRADYSDAVMASASRAGYTVAFAIEDHRMTDPQRRHAIPRIVITGHVPHAFFEAKVSNTYSLMGKG